MVIEINKDIDRYKETVVMGLTARQLIFSVASIAVGGGLVLILYQYIGLTPSVYVAIPAVAPIALGGFYSFNGMNFYEFMGRKIRMMFKNRPLTYVSAESEEVIRKIRMEEDAGKKAAEKKRGSLKKTHKSSKKGNQEEFENMKKKAVKMLAGVVAVIAAAVIQVQVIAVLQGDTTELHLAAPANCRAEKLVAVRKFLQSR